MGTIKNNKQAKICKAIIYGCFNFLILKINILLTKIKLKYLRLGQDIYRS